jgi:hypothetical protein
VTAIAPTPRSPHLVLTVAVEIVDKELLGTVDGHQAILDRLAELAAGQLDRHAADQVLTAHAAGITLDRLRSAARDPETVRARQAVMAGLADAGWSSPRIGRYLNRDHSTVLHGIARHRERTAGCETCDATAMGGGRWCHRCFLEQTGRQAAA